MAGGVLFGPAAWDPVAIIAQIVALQCLYYLSLGLLYKMIVGGCWCAGQDRLKGTGGVHTPERPPAAAALPCWVVGPPAGVCLILPAQPAHPQHPTCMA